MCISVDPPQEPAHSLVRWKASRFSYCTEAGDGTLLVYNSFVGALARIGSEDIPAVRRALCQGITGIPSTGPLPELILNGFFVSGDTDEPALARALHDRTVASTDALELALMPNENCNFRCVYCYESFDRGKMQRDVLEGIVAHVRRRSPALTSLHIGWFGGEPLTAPEIIREVSTRLREISGEAGIHYESSMVTNGYDLTPEIADLLFEAEVRKFQITVDGPEEEHDRLRVLADGKSGTFRRIYSNLTLLRDRKDCFRVVIRVNFDNRSSLRVGPFLEQLQRDFGQDERFHLDFHPVGRWGGRNDGRVEVCGRGEGAAFRTCLFREAVGKGFDVQALRQRMEPCGSVCYAANPSSFVIGADGTAYKCTVAFGESANRVGRITAAGDLLLDDEKLALWTRSGDDNDEVCRKCFFRPPCQGNACPLARIRTGRQPCPTAKTNIDGILRVLAAEAVQRISADQRE